MSRFDDDIWAVGRRVRRGREGKEMRRGSEAWNEMSMLKRRSEEHNGHDKGEADVAIKIEEGWGGGGEGTMRVLAREQINET